jgi:serine/threonine-protein kinase BUR1
MDRVLERTPDGTSPRTFALNHLRPKSSFQGCSRIADYELLGKLGEGTFGYSPFSRPLDASGDAC